MTTFVGLDVSQAKTTVCIVDERGLVTWRGEPCEQIAMAMPGARPGTRFRPRLPAAGTNSHGPMDHPNTWLTAMG